MTVDGNQNGAPNYFPNSFSGADHSKRWAQHVDTLTGDVARHDSSNDDNFSQVSSAMVGGLSHLVTSLNLPEIFIS